MTRLPEKHAEDPIQRPTRPKHDFILSQCSELAILTILNSKVKIGIHSMSVLEAAHPNMGNSRNNGPPYELAAHLHNKLALSTLSTRQKQTLFSLLEWRFECIKCHRCLSPKEFKTGFYLWGPKGQDPNPQLRSGPCNDCVEKRPEDEEIVVLSVNLPEACK